ncbi:hypothetical protein ACFWU5_23650 [Nocardia sp. NPDC058640]
MVSSLGDAPGVHRHLGAAVPLGPSHVPHKADPEMVLVGDPVGRSPADTR